MPLSLPFTKSNGRSRVSSRASWDMVRELARAEFKMRYQGSAIGYLWSLVKPLAIFGVLYTVFTVFGRIGSGKPSYAISLLLGIVLWTFFSESTISGMRSIVDRGDLIRKIYFPRIFILISSSVSALITLGLNLVVILGFMLATGVYPTVHSLLFFLLVAELYLLCLGASLFLGALFVKFRDFTHVWEVVMQLLFYASAIILPLELFPSRYIKLIVLSPVTQILQDARKLFVDPTALSTFGVHPFPIALIPYLIPPVLAVAGFFFFQYSASRFAEDV